MEHLRYLRFSKSNSNLEEAEVMSRRGNGRDQYCFPISTLPPHPEKIHLRCAKNCLKGKLDRCLGFHTFNPGLNNRD